MYGIVMFAHSSSNITVTSVLMKRTRVLVYKCLADELKYTADLGTWRRLRSFSSLTLKVHCTRLSTVGDRAFPVAAASNWNNLPQHVTSAPSMSVFRSHLKAFLFRHSFIWLLPQLL